MNEIAIIITLLGNVRTAFASLMILALQLSKVVERLYLLTIQFRRNRIKIYRPLGYERVYLHFVKWQIHPFISKGTNYIDYVFCLIDLTIFVNSSFVKYYYFIY